MNKSELTDKIADKAGLTKAQASAAIDAVFATIMDTVAAGDTATFVGFGTFKRAERAARTGKNPKTGEALQIAASKTAKFAPGAAFKKKVNGG